MSRRRPSPALIVACIALAVALSGTSYAALLPKNSIGTAHIRKNAVTSAKVKDRSLLAIDFKSGQLPAGPPGAPGERGETGAKGEKGDRGDAGPPGMGEHQIVQASSPTDTSVWKSVTASCPTGKTVVGGGASASNPAVWLAMSYPVNANAWRAVAERSSAVLGSWSVQVYAICARIS